MTRPRYCTVCGESLDGRAATALYCTGACRAEAARVRTILAGTTRGPYFTLADRLRARGRSMRRLLKETPKESASTGRFPVE